MNFYDGLPPELYEIINCGLATAAFIVWIETAFYLLTRLRSFMAEGDTLLQVIISLMTLRLALGTFVFLSGEWPRMTWLWVARYIKNTGHDPSWMAGAPWVYIPIVASTIAIIGLACFARAIVPQSWGRIGYWFTLLTPVVVIILTQVIR